MNKEEFVSFIAEKRDCSKADATNALNMVIDSITDALVEGESVNLVKFGIFEVKHRAAREGRNPQTGAPLKIAASNQPGFRAGKTLKDACNNSDNAHKTKAKADAKKTAKKN